MWAPILREVSWKIYKHNRRLEMAFSPHWSEMKMASLDTKEDNLFKVYKYLNGFAIWSAMLHTFWRDYEVNERAQILYFESR